MNIARKRHRGDLVYRVPFSRFRTCMEMPAKVTEIQRGQAMIGEWLIGASTTPLRRSR